MNWRMLEGYDGQDEVSRRSRCGYAKRQGLWTAHASRRYGPRIGTEQDPEQEEDRGLT
jgi:hypothetical protein